MKFIKALKRNESVSKDNASVKLHLSIRMNEKNEANYCDDVDNVKCPKLAYKLEKYEMIY